MLLKELHMNPHDQISLKNILSFLKGIMCGNTKLFKNVSLGL